MDAKVVQLGAYALARKNSRLSGGCKHLHLELDENGEIVECRDCGKELTPWFALMTMLKYIGGEQERLAQQQKYLVEETDKKLHLLAARKVEKAWRSPNEYPRCPHCGEGIAPSDMLGHWMINKRFHRSNRPKSPPADDTNDRRP